MEFKSKKITFLRKNAVIEFGDFASSDEVQKVWLNRKYILKQTECNYYIYYFVIDINFTKQRYYYWSYLCEQPI